MKNWLTCDANKGRMATMVENEGRVVDDQELVVVEEKDDESRKPNII